MTLGVWFCKLTKLQHFHRTAVLFGPPHAWRIFVRVLWMRAAVFFYTEQEWMALIYLQPQNAADISMHVPHFCHCEANACFTHWVVACAQPGYIRPRKHCFHLLGWFSSLWSCLTKSFWTVVGFHWLFFFLHLVSLIFQISWVFQMSCLRSRQVNSLVPSHLSFSLSCRNTAIKTCSLQTRMCLDTVGIECGHVHFWDM